MNDNSLFHHGKSCTVQKNKDKCQDQTKNAVMQVLFKKFQKIRNNMILQLNIV